MANAASPTACIAIAEKRNGNHPAHQDSGEHYGFAIEIFGPSCACSLKAEKSTSAVSAAEPMAKPLPMAAVVLPTASSLSVRARTSVGSCAHLGDAAGVVGDRAVGVDRELDSDRAQHSESGESDTVESGQKVRGDDCRGQEQKRPRGGLHAESESGDDVRRGPGLSGGGDGAGRLSRLRRCSTR